MADRNRRTPVEHIDDRELLVRAAADDPDAVRELYRRSAPGAWGLAMVVCGTEEAASAAVVDGFANAVGALADGALDTDEAFRPYVLAATRGAALESGDRFDDHVDEFAGRYAERGPVAASTRAFGELPEASRSALWLADVEMMGDEQLAVALEATADETDEMVKQAREALHEHLQRSLIEDATEPECALVTGQLSAALADKVDDLGVEAVHEHLTACPDCRDRREQLVSATDRLGAIAAAPPDTLERDTLNRWRGAVGLPLVTTGRTPIVRGVGSKHATAEHAAITADSAAHPFDVPEPAMERWKRTLAQPGPITSTRSRRSLVAAAAAALLLAGGIAAGVHSAPSHQVRTALTTDGTAEGSVVVRNTTTTVPTTTPTTLPPLATGIPDLSALAAITGGSSPVMPAGSGRATSGGATGVPHGSNTAPTTGAPPTQPAPTTTKAPTPTTKPSPPTTARYCVTWTLGHPPANPIEALIDPCKKWSS